MQTGESWGRVYCCAAIVLLAVDAAGAFPVLNSETKLNASGSVAISGDTVVVNTTALWQPGDAVIFVRSSEGWAQQQAVRGRGSIYLEGDTLVFGTNVYRRHGATWTLEHTFTVEGIHTAVSGDTIVRGNWRIGPDLYTTYGAVDVYVRNGTNWIHQTRIFPREPKHQMGFGEPLALSGNRLVVGAPGIGGFFQDQIPRVYVYERRGDDWVEQATLFDGTGRTAAECDFGAQVATAGNTILVPAGSGELLVFAKSGTNWVVQQRLQSTEAISLNGEIALTDHAFAVGDWGPGGVARIHLFRFDGETWTRFPTPADTGAYTVGHFAISAGALVVNSPSTRGVFVYESRPWEWQNADIGASQPAGSLLTSGNALTLTGSGEIDGTRDAFHYAYRSWTGDGVFTVRINDVQGPNGWSRGGIMLRASLAADSPHAFFFHRLADASGLQARTNLSEETAHTHGTWYQSPYWLRLIRQGSNVTAHQSLDRNTWTPRGSATVNLPETILAGLAVTSHQPGTLATAQFDHLEISRTSETPSAPVGLIATYAPTNLIRLRWSDTSFNETGFRLEISTDNVRFSPLGTLKANTTDYWISTDDWTTADRESVLYFRVQATSHAGNSAYSAVATVAKPTDYSLPPPWRSRDIGQVPSRGNALAANGMFIITGTGHLWSFADSFHYLYQPWSGDGEIRAFLGWQSDNQFYAYYGGVMFRQSLLPDSVNAFAFDNTLQGRETPGGYTTHDAISAPSAPWLRLTRSNHVFTAYTSQDGINWSRLSSRTIPMIDPILVGFVASGHIPMSFMFADIQLIPYGPVEAPVIHRLTRQPGGAIQLTIQCPAGHTYALEASANLQDWATIASDLTSSGTTIFADPDAHKFPARFYRLVRGP